jgi:hypothetical protein
MGGPGRRRRPRADEILAGCAPEVVALAGALRAQLIGMIDGVVEEADAASGRIRFRRRGLFAFLEPMGDHIRVGFDHGDVLPDLTGRLEAGTGTVRTLALRTLDEIGAREVKMLLSAALFDDDTHGFRRRRAG